MSSTNSIYGPEGLASYTIPSVRHLLRSSIDCIRILESGLEEKIFLESEAEHARDAIEALEKVVCAANSSVNYYNAPEIINSAHDLYIEVLKDGIVEKCELVESILGEDC